MCYYENKKTFNLIALSCVMGMICSTPAFAKQSNSSQDINIHSNAINYDYSKESITATTNYVAYTPGCKKLSGYAKDQYGNPLANRRVFIKEIPKTTHREPTFSLVEDFYDVVTTDNNGYYSCWIYNSDEYDIYLANEETFWDVVLDIYDNGRSWPCKWILNDGDYYKSDVRCVTVAIIR